MRATVVVDNRKSDALPGEWGRRVTPGKISVFSRT